MDINDTKYTSILSNLEAEFLLKMQEYAEVCALAHLLVVRLDREVKSLASWVQSSLKIDGEMEIDLNTPASIAIESGARKALWIFNNFQGSFPQDKRLIVYDREKEILHELLKTLNLLIQVKDLK